MYPFRPCFSLGIFLGVELQGHMVALFLVFKATSILLSIVAVPIYIPTSSAEGFPSLHTLSSIYCLWIFLMIAILTDMTWLSHCSFDFHFCSNHQCWASFPVPFGHLLWRNVGLLPIFWLAGFDDVKFHELFINFGD